MKVDRSRRDELMNVNINHGLKPVAILDRSLCDKTTFVMQPTSELPNYVQAKIGRNKWLDANFKHGLKPLAIHEQSLCGKKRLQFPPLNATAPSELQKSNHVGRHDLTGRIIVDGVPNQRNSLSATKERFGCYQAATLCAKKYSPSHAV
jgi:hypothetical protein